MSSAAVGGVRSWVRVRKESFFGGGVWSIIPTTVLHLSAYAIPPEDRFVLDWVEETGGRRAARGQNGSSSWGQNRKDLIQVYKNTSKLQEYDSYKTFL